MPDSTPNLALPQLLPAQAQKHVTHNAALDRLDVAVQLVVQGLDADLPPPAPQAGQVWAVGALPGDDWEGAAGQLAFWDGTGWQFVTPRAGWRAWDAAGGQLRLWRGGTWEPFPLDGLDGQNLAGLGIGTTHDATSRLAVAAAATLLTHAGAGHQLKLNKATAAETGSLLFQTGWAGRAEIGLAGSDDLSVKVSTTGGSWTEALRAEAATGRLRLPQGAVIDGAVTGSAVTQSATDAAAGRLLKTGDGGILGAISLDSLDLDAAPYGFFGTGSAALPPPAPPDGSAGDSLWAGLTAGSGTAGLQLAARTDAARALYRRSRDPAGWSGWHRIFDQATVLGPVSQAGGLPTGALVEQGSTADGAYLRLADGTQICWHSAEAAAHAVTLADGALFRSDAPLTLAFAAAFAAAPVVTVSLHAAAGSPALLPGGITPGSGSAAITILATAAVTVTPLHLMYTAIGRWF